LKANGFKKVGSKFYRELAAATCMVGFAKARGCGPDELCWQASGTIFLHALDPIFRAERDSTTLGTIDGDVNLLLCRPSGQLWEITEATNVASMVSDFQSVLLAKLDGLEQKGSLRSLAETYTPDHLVNPGKLSINGLTTMRHFWKPFRSTLKVLAFSSSTTSVWLRISNFTAHAHHLPPLPQRSS